MLRCRFCGQEVSPERPGVYKLIEGWVEIRSQGGSHAVALPGPPQDFAHGTCIRLQTTLAEQPSLFQ